MWWYCMKANQQNHREKRKHKKRRVNSMHWNQQKIQYSLHCYMVNIFSYPFTERLRIRRKMNGKIGWSTRIISCHQNYNEDNLLKRENFYLIIYTNGLSENQASFLSSRQKPIRFFFNSPNHVDWGPLFIPFMFLYSTDIIHYSVSVDSAPPIEKFHVSTWVRANVVLPHEQNVLLLIYDVHLSK